MTRLLRALGWTLVVLGTPRYLLWVCELAADRYDPINVFAEILWLPCLIVGGLSHLVYLGGQRLLVEPPEPAIATIEPTTYRG